MNIKFIVMATLLFFIVPKAEAQSCTGCTDTKSGGGKGAINVTAGQTVCLTSGTFTPGSLTIAAGGTLCIGSGVTLDYSKKYGFTVSGTVVNHGTLLFKGTDDLGSGEIDNYGTISQDAYIGACELTINNYGSIILGNTLSGFSGTIENHGLFQVDKIVTTSTAYIDNRDSFIHTNSSIDLNGTFDNSGYAYFAGMGGTGLNATINNYGYFKVDGALNVNAATYFTNDSLVIFNASLNFEGPLLTNSETGRIYVNGDFEVNSPQMEFSNSGLVTVIGTFDYNQAASGANNCRIYASGEISLHSGLFKNEGLLWTGTVLTVNNATLKNGATGFVRGTDFTNHYSIVGLGKFYFTGTIENGGGTIAGDSANNPIIFYTSGGTSIPSGGTVTNVTIASTSSSTPLDTTSFDCSSTPELPPAGNPPNLKGDTIILCHVGDTYTFNLISDSLIVPYDSTYYIYWPALKLFDPDSSSNPTNNTLNLTTAQGTFVADTVNKTIVFTPAASFTYGMAKAQFKAADKTNGDPITYTSGKATLVINLIPVYAPDTLEVNGF